MRIDMPYQTRLQVRTMKYPFHEALVDAWTFSGHSNDNPPAGIRGVKGNVLTPYNFAWNGSSGFGKYAKWINKGSYTPGQGSIDFYYNKLIFNLTSAGETHVQYGSGWFANNGIRLKVSGLLENGDHIKIYNNTTVYFDIYNNGFHEIPPTVFTETINIKYYCSVANDNVVLEQIPEHQGSLLSDGVDDYLTCNTMPVLDDCTIIYKRTYYNGDNSGTFLTVGNNSISIEALNNIAINEIKSFGYVNHIPLTDSNVSYFTKKSYDGKAIINGDISTNNILSLFRWQGTSDKYKQCAISFLAIYNKSLTPEEIEEEKLKLEEVWLSKIKVDIPEPEADFNFANLPSGVNELMDETGKHSLKLYNFAHSGMSGKDGDALVFDGIDDYCKVDNSIVNTPIKTVVMDFVPLNLGYIAYDHRRTYDPYLFALFTEKSGVAWNTRNASNITYINGSINKNIIGEKLLNIRHTATLVNNNVVSISPPVIGGNFHMGSGAFQKMALYRILLFKEALTELQIKKVMYKYKLTKFDKI